ncbi:MAG: carbamoyltransferase HypF [Acidobacteria bacterium]|nr:carbamoyltransferase HypF [Acidobacteriota bacterium]
MTDHRGSVERLRVSIRGAVQGVGFRPFVYRLAAEMSLPGWVINSAAGVIVEVEGRPETLREFLVRLERERPPRAVVQGLEPCWLDPAGFERFEIRHSEGGERRTLILPDIAPCDDCLRELRDPADRRYRYPFVNCTNCGPRFTIIEGLPYDRPLTTMKRFRMCPACQAEYDDPRDRRFHAQPNACPACGPRLQLWAPDGRCLYEADEALRYAANAISQGLIVAVKGLGGFHLVVDARHEAALERLREAKGREEKPFAVMVPGLDAARHECEVGPLEARLLASPEAPIVLMDRRLGGSVAAAVAPRNPTLGLMLPSTPLHHLLLAELQHPVVATSGNRADETICTDEREALARLAGVADLFLVHDRPIARHADDSIVRVVLGRELVLRRARGYAPLPIGLAGTAAARGNEAPSVLGVGAHLKNTVAISVGDAVFVSQHIGDLETPQANEAFEHVIADLERMYQVSRSRVACDLHPDYLSTAYARAAATPAIGVQHHVAHVLSCMAENEQEPPLLGVAWDGTGYGEDGRIWGGEWFEVAPSGVRRVASLSPFGLPGGDAAVRDARRSAAALLFALHGGAAFAMDDLAPIASFPPIERRTLRTMLERGLNTPLTSSAGRLFDGVASLLNLRHRVAYEGQAAIELEWAARGGRPGCTYPFVIHEGREFPPGERDEAPALVDWQPMLEALVADLRAGAPAADLARRFHDTLAEMIVAVASRQGLERVVLSGGCFQNRCLTERAVTRLREAGFRPFWHQRIPPNDGGIALGQVVAAAWGMGTQR